MNMRVAAPCISRLPGRGGGAFSLLEVMCAVLVLGVAVVGLTEGITTALRGSKESEIQATAALYAAGLIEDLRAEGWLVNGTDEGNCGPGLSHLKWKKTVSAGEMDGLHEVQVVILDASGKSVYELKTLLFEIPEDRPADRTQDRRKNSGKDRRQRS